MMLLTPFIGFITLYYFIGSAFWFNLTAKTRPVKLCVSVLPWQQLLQAVLVHCRPGRVLLRSLRNIADTSISCVSFSSLLIHSVLLWSHISSNVR